MAEGWRMTGLAAGMASVLVLGACVSTPGCAKPAASVEGHERVEIDGHEFSLELVADNASRTVGLGGRESVPEDGGMLFSFPDARVRHFVMRDCLVDIDIIFLDADGRIVAMHHMPVEEPRRPGETQMEYELRLPRYSSRFNARYAIELRGGMLENLDLQPGQKIELDTERLEGLTD